MVRISRVVSATIPRCVNPFWVLLWNPVGLQVFVPIGTVSWPTWQIIHTHCPRCRSNFIGNIACGTCEMVLRLDLNDIQLDTLTIIDAVLGNGVFNDFLKYTQSTFRNSDALPWLAMVLLAFSFYRGFPELPCFNDFLVILEPVIPSQHWYDPTIHRDVQSSLSTLFLFLWTYLQKFHPICWGWSWFSDSVFAAMPVNTLRRLLRYFPHERESLQRQVMKTAGILNGIWLEMSGRKGQHQMHCEDMAWKCVWCNCITVQPRN